MLSHNPQNWMQCHDCDYVGIIFHIRIRAKIIGITNIFK
jgi:hypothetical protein